MISPWRAWASSAEVDSKPPLSSSTQMSCLAAPQILAETRKMLPIILTELQSRQMALSQHQGAILTHPTPFSQQAAARKLTPECNLPRLSMRQLDRKLKPSLAVKAFR